MIRISIGEAGKSPQLLTFNAWSITLGRASSHELCLTGKGVSSTHCRITREGESYFIEDLGSTNGTYVNRNRVQGRQPLGPRDEVVLAIYRLRVVADNESGASIAPVGAPPGVGAGPQPPAMVGAPMTSSPAASPSPPAHVAPPTGYPAPMSTGHGAGTPSGHSMAPPGYPSAVPPAGYPGSSPAGYPTSGPSLHPAGPSAANPAQHPMGASGGYPGSSSSVPPSMPMGSGPSVPPSSGPNAGQGSLTASAGGVGSGPSAGSRGKPTDVAWEREWQQIDRLSQAWLASGKNPNDLLRGEKLKHARQWMAQGRGKHPQPKPLHREFIVAGSRASGLRSFGVFLVVVLLLGGLGVAAWFVFDREPSDDEGDDQGLLASASDAGGGSGPNKPQDRGNRGASDAIAITAEGLVSVDPVLAALVATEAVSLLPRDDQALDAPAFAALRQALRRLPGRPLHGGGGSIEAVALSPDGRWAVTSERAGDVRLWDLDKPGVLRPSYLRGHARGVTAMEVSRDGRWLITADADGLAQRWNLLDPDPSASGVRLESHRAPIGAIDLSANGRWLVTGDDVGQVKLWDLDQSLPDAISLPRGHEAKVTGVAITDEGTRVLSSGEDMTARNWRINAGRPGRAPVVVAHGEEVQVTAIAVAGDESSAISGVSDGTVYLWSPTSAAPARKWVPLVSHKRPVTHLAVTADGSLGVSAAEDNALVVWELRAKEPAAGSVRLLGHTDRIQSLQVFSTPADVPANRRAPATAFTASADGTARSWNLDNRKVAVESRVFYGHAGGVRSVAVSGDGQWAITGGDGGLARVWDWQSLPLAAGDAEAEPPLVGSASIAARGHAKAVVAVAVDRFGRRMLTGSADGTARVWDLRNPARVLSLPLKDLHESPVRAVAVSPDPQWGATGDDAGRLVIWDILEDRPVGRALEGHTGEIGDVAFTPDGKRLVSVSTDRSARVWTVGKNIQESVVVLPHRDEVNQLAVSGDGRWLLTGTLTEAVLWKLEGGTIDTEPVRSFRKHEDDITAVAMGPRGRWAATGSVDRRAILYDLDDKKASATTLRGHEDVVRVLAFQPTGQWLATGSDDKSIRLWDLQSAHPDERSSVLPGHEGGITDLVWSLDGRWLVSASNDGTIRLWDTKRELVEMVENVIVLEGHSAGSPVRQVGLVPGDGDRGIEKLVSASYDGTARLWPLDAASLVPIGCTRAGRSLTEEEWAEHIGGTYDPSCE